MSAPGSAPTRAGDLARHVTPRRVVIGAFVVLAVAAIVVIAGPGGSVAEDGPEGTLALRRMLGTLGLDGGDTGEPPEAGTFVLLADLRTPDESEELLDWARRGNRLVLADPASPTARLVGVEPSRSVGGNLFGVARIPADCAPLAGVSEVAFRTTDRRLRTDTDASACLGTPPAMVELTVGDGRVAVLGGPSPLTNELLADADNAAFAVRLLAPHNDGPVQFGPPRPLDGAGAGLWRSLPDGVRAAATAAGIALLLFALVRGRRLGMPPDESPAAPLPQSALVGATGDLLQMSGDVAHTHALLRDATVERLRRRLGQPPGTPPSDLARMVAAATGRDADGVTALLDGAPAPDSEQLVHAARALEHLVQDLGTGGTTPPPGLPPNPRDDAPPNVTTRPEDDA